MSFLFVSVSYDYRVVSLVLVRYSYKRENKVRFIIFFRFSELQSQGDVISFSALLLQKGRERVGFMNTRSQPLF